jgi:hypothetical protein
MWSTRISLDAKNPEVVTITAHDNDFFSYSETLMIDKFNVSSFVAKAIAERNKMIAGRTKIFAVANKVAQDIFNALNKGIESVVSVEKSAVQCSEKVIEAEIMEK